MQVFFLVSHISLGFGGGAGANLYPRINTIVGGSYGVSHIGGSYITGGGLRATGLTGVKFGFSIHIISTRRTRRWRWFRGLFAVHTYHGCYLFFDDSTAVQAPKRKKANAGKY